MGGLDDEAERLVAALIALGEKAIGPLRRFLLEGRPSTVYQPRRWAVQALGGLGDSNVELPKRRSKLRQPLFRDAPEQSVGELANKLRRVTSCAR